MLKIGGIARQIRRECIMNGSAKGSGEDFEKYGISVNPKERLEWWIRESWNACWDGHDIPRSELIQLEDNCVTTHSSTAAAGLVDDARDLITLVCIFDTHNSTPSGIPDGGILLHAGDLTNKGTFAELQAQLDWINTLPHPHKVVIGGNHDRILDEEFVSKHPNRSEPGDSDRRYQLDWGSITYLRDLYNDHCPEAQPHIIWVASYP
jgi:hypothetical protein